MKYNTMNNDEIILSLCARLKETRLSLSMTQQQLADRAHVGIATIKRIEKGGGLNLDTLISLLRALDKLHNLDVWGSDQFWAELVQPGRTSKPCVARGVVI